MVLLADAVSVIRVGKARNTVPSLKNIENALSGNRAGAIAEEKVLPKIKTCKEIVAELKRKPLTYILLNGKPILCNLGNNIKLS